MQTARVSVLLMPRLAGSHVDVQRQQRAAARGGLHAWSQTWVGACQRSAELLTFSSYVSPGQKVLVAPASPGTESEKAVFLRQQAVFQRFRCRETSCECGCNTWPRDHPSGEMDVACSSSSSLLVIIRASMAEFGRNCSCCGVLQAAGGVSLHPINGERADIPHSHVDAQQAD